MRKVIKATGLVGLAAAVTVSNVYAIDSAENTNIIEINEDSNNKEVTENDVKKVKDRLNSLSEDIKEKKNIINNLKASADSAKTLSTKLEALLKDAENLVKEATAENIEIAANAIKAIEDKISTLSKTNDETKATKEEASKVVDAQKNLVNAAEKDFEDKNKIVLKAKEAVKLAEDIVDGMSIEKLTLKVNESKEDLETAKLNAEKAKEAVESLKQVEINSKREIDNIVEQSDAHKVDLRTKEAAKNESVENLRISIEKKKKLEAKTNEIKFKINNLKRMINENRVEIENRLRDAREAFNIAKYNKINAQRELERAQANDSRHRYNLSEAEEDFNDANARLESTKRELNNITDRYNRALPNKSLLDNGRRQYLQGNYNVVYGRWNFASTGCVPTALAMVYSELKGTQITPIQVGDYLYKKTNDFNKTELGTAGVGILKATRGFGLVATPLRGKQNLLNALKEGHIVVVAVQNDRKFSPWGPRASHEIVLKSLRNGRTYVLDPRTYRNRGWHSIDDIWNHKSKDPGDVNGIGDPFIKISTYEVENLAKERNKIINKRNSDSERRENALRALNNVRNYTSQVSYRRSELERAEREVVEKQREVQRLESSFRATRDIDDLHYELNSLEAELTNKNRELNEAKGDVSRKTAIKNEKTASYNEVLNEIKALNTKLAKFKLDIEKVEKAKALLIAQQDALEKADSKYKENVKVLENSKLNIDDKQALLTAARADLKEKEVVMSNSKKNLDAELAKLEAKTKSLNDVIAKLEELDQQKVSLEKELAAAKKKLEDLKNADAKLEEAKQNSINANNDLKDKNDELAQAMNLLEEVEEDYNKESKNYGAIMAQYQLVLEEQRQLKLIQEYKKIKESGNNPIAIKEDKGIIVGYKSEADMKPKRDLLPKTSTGEQNDTIFVVGILAAALSLLGISRKKNK